MITTEPSMDWTDILDAAGRAGIDWNTAHNMIDRSGILPHWGETSVGCWELSEIEQNSRLSEEMKAVFRKFFKEHDLKWINITQ